MFSKILTALGLITGVVGPVITAAVGNPLLTSNHLLQGVLAGLGVFVVLAGVAHDALLTWQASNEEHLQAMAKIAPPVTPKI
jgi:hypothetical protein